MDQVLDHQAGDLIVDAQAGARLADAAGSRRRGRPTARARRDRARAPRIGGALATNASGPQRMLVGTARDLLIGITVVRADGVVAKAGGRVVKNVAGYDLGKLLIGSFGTLAVVTEAMFRLHPVPAAQRWVTMPGRRPGRGARRLAQAVVHAQVVPAAVEVDWPADGRGTVTVLLAGSADGVDGRAATSRGLLGERRRGRPTSAPAGWSTYPWRDRGRPRSS